MNRWPFKQKWFFRDKDLERSYVDKLVSFFGPGTPVVEVEMVNPEWKGAYTKVGGIYVIPIYHPPVGCIRLGFIYPTSEGEKLACLAHEAGHAEAYLSAPLGFMRPFLLREVEDSIRGLKYAHAWGIEPEYRARMATYMGSLLRSPPWHVIEKELEEARGALEALRSRMLR